MTRRPSTSSRTTPHKTRSSFAALCAAAGGGAFAATLLLTAGFARPSITPDTFRQLDLFGEVFEKVHESYVEAPDDGKMIKGAINGMLSTLDPHSSYLDADDFKRMQEQTRGTFAGLGITVTMDSDGDTKGLVRIVSPIEGTPASRAGLQPNDLIVAIDGEPVFGNTLDDAIEKLKGPKGSPVELSVLRDKDAGPFDVSIVRDIITVPSVQHRVERGNIGYVWVTNFSEQTTEQLDAALKGFDKDVKGGVRGIILDLRNDPGGLLDQAVGVADEFLDGGEIVSTRGRNPKDTLRELGTPGDRLSGRPIVVLINGGTASASEIVAGALQDRNRALLLGTKSFGKGSVQTVLPLQNGLQGALRLTTARYYTPAGRSIQAKGIEPDILMPIVRPGQDAPVQRRGEADLPGALDVDKSKDAAAPEDDGKAAVETGAAAQPEPATDCADGDSACAATTDSESVETAEENGVKPVECPQDKDCQLERALDLIADMPAYRQALALAGEQQRD